MTTAQQPIFNQFSGVPVDADSILVKYTINGDADLTGVIDADDFFHIDRGWRTGGTIFRDGDFNYSGTIDADDYALIRCRLPATIPRPAARRASKAATARFCRGSHWPDRAER